MTSGQLKVAKIITKRDEISMEEAKDMVMECVDVMNEDIMNSEEILADLLGLEPDYLFDLLDLC